jgi:hypothetical protein
MAPRFMLQLMQMMFVLVRNLFEATAATLKCGAMHRRCAQRGAS